MLRHSATKAVSSGAFWDGKLMQYGVRDVLLKPYTPAALVEIIS